ncbi:MAG: hypothetical protein ABI977_00515 [Acidobacteriota bacterium]
MKTYDVIVERNNGHFRALFPALPNIAAERATRDEAIAAAAEAAQRYLREVEITTVHLVEPFASLEQQEEPRYRPAIEREFAMAAEANSQDAEIRRGSLQSVLRAAADCRIDTTTELYKEYVADLATERERQRAEAEREADEAEA